MKKVQTPSTVAVPVERRCPRCGAPLGGFGPEGLCGACLFDAGLTEEAPSVELDLLAAGSRRFGDYELLEEIARGGMGVVFKARQLNLNRIVAVKMVLRGDFAGVAELARFRAEAETAARLQHPNIVAIHEVGEQEGQPFFSMDYVQGQDLARLVGNAPLPATRAATYLKTIAETVEYAHQQGVLHRDLKPSNVLIDSATDAPRLTDFGLAKRFEGDASLTITGQVLGSPSFIPPEQASGRNEIIGPASDVYSLGAILYHLLTARPPFVAESVTATLRLVAETDPVSPRLLNGSVPRDLETICLKCLQKEPGRRYATAKAMADDLGRFLRDEPIHARPVTRVEKTMRWCWRYPALAGLTMLVALLVIAVTAILAVSVVRLRQADQDGREKLRESLVAQAHANRWSGRPGRRFNSLDALQKANDIRFSIELRNEAIACMALADVRPVKTWRNSSGIKGPFFDARYERYTTTTTNGNVILVRAQDDAELAQWQGFGVPVNELRFSPDGRSLAVLFTAIANGSVNSESVFKIYDTRASNRIQFALADRWIRGFSFSNDSRRLAVIWMAENAPGPGCMVTFYDLATSRELNSFPLPNLPFGFAFNPEGSLVAISSDRSREVQIRDVPSGDLRQTILHSNGVYGVSWSPDGSRLVTGCADGRAYVWQMARPMQLGLTLPHEGQVISLEFNPSGDLLATQSWDGFFRLWDAYEGRMLIRTPGTFLDLNFAPDGRHLVIESENHKIQMLEIADGHEWQRLHFPVGRGQSQPYCCFSTDGQMLLICQDNFVRVWDVIAHKEITTLSLPGDALFAGFHPTVKGMIVTCDDEGIAFWPRGRETNVESGGKLTTQWQAGSPRRVTNSPSLFSATMDRMGKIIVGTRDGKIAGWDLETGKPLKEIMAPVGLYHSVMDPSGRWLLGLPYRMDLHEAYVWEVSTCTLVQTVDMRNVHTGAFSPDSRLMFTGSWDEFVCWEAGSWRRLYSIPRKSVTDALFAFTSEGSLGAVTVSAHAIRLFVPETGEELATLEAPDEATVQWLAFNPDGSLLAVADRNNCVHLWDLQTIRGQLAGMKMDWTLTSPAASGPGLRLAVLTPTNATTRQNAQLK
jgi:eukaryotic-like serine/threonine-protein kinase